MMKSRSRSEYSEYDIGKTPLQDAKSGSFGERLKYALAGREMGWLAEKTGIPDSTLGGYISGGMPRADKAVLIANVLNVSVEWLIGGKGPVMPTALIDAADADWIMLPRYSLADFRPEGKPEPIDTIPLRRDWLNRNALAATRLWLTTMPPSFIEDGPEEGDMILCRDVAAPDGEGVYLWFLDGMPLVQRLRVDPFTPAGVRTPGRAWQVPPDEGGPQLVARIIGSIKMRGV